MSFRARFTTFFVLIVVVPMVAMGVLIFRLIGDSQQGKADARASGLATARPAFTRARPRLGAGTRKRWLGASERYTAEL